MSVDAPERIWVDVKAMSASSVAGRAPFFGVGYVRLDKLEELAAALAEKDKEIAALKGALEPFARVADLIDVETEGLSDDDEVSLLFHDYLMDLYTVADFRRARNAGGKDAE